MFTTWEHWLQGQKLHRGVGSTESTVQCRGRSLTFYCIPGTCIDRHEGTKTEGKNKIDLVLSYMILGLGSGSGAWDRVQVLESGSC